MFGNKGRYVIAVLVSLLLVVTAGCDMGGIIGNDESGSLLIRFADTGVASRTLLPQLSMEISSYRITGEGPRGEVFTGEISSSDSFSRSSLLEGSWLITVEAFNGDDVPVLIGEGSAIVDVVASVVTEATIEVFPLDGTGDFSLEVDWDRTLTNPALDFILKNAADEQVVVTETFSISEEVGSLDIFDLPTGYYLLEVVLTEGQTPVGFAVETLRIVDGQTTSGLLSIITDKTGDIQIAITQLMDDPIEISFNGFEAILAPETDMTVQAIPSVSVDAFAWYLNGVRLPDETTDTITLGALLADGCYQLTAVVWKGNIVCSEMVEFTIAGFGTISSTVVSGTTGDPISGATVSVQNFTELTTTTASDGTFTIYDIPIGTQTLLITCDGFSDLSMNVEVASGDNSITPPALSPVFTSTENLRIILTWDANPQDLDSHLLTPNGQHIYYANSHPTEAGAWLDVDDTTSFGPETVTIETIQEGTYKYFVHHYFGEGSITSTSLAKVEVYDSTGLIATYYAPTSGTGIYWDIFTFDGSTITTVNVMQDSQPTL